MDEHNPAAYGAPNRGVDPDYERVLLESMKHSTNDNMQMTDEELIMQQVIEESRRMAAGRR